jgi:hypothetical protein
LTSGSSRPEPARTHELAAGRWSAILDGALVHSVRAGDTEVAQRVYVAVRDADWNTIPGEILSAEVSRGPRVAEAVLEVRHRLGPVDFSWHGTVTLDEEHGFRFAFAGRAASSFVYTKVGLNVHHPLETTIGRRLRAHTPTGWMEHTVSTQIAPQAFQDGRFSAMFREYDALEIEVWPGSFVTFRFTGDRWEMQDHRNWTDANLKSYLTLTTPAPARMVAGAQIDQSVEIRADQGLLPRRARRTSTRGADDVVITRQSAPRLPEIGVELDESDLLPEPDSPDIGQFRPAYLRVPLHPSRRDLPERLERAGLWQASLGVPIELAIFVSPDDPEALTALDRSLLRMQLPVERFAVFDEGAELDGRSGSTWPETFTSARRRLTALSQVSGGVGTDRFFAELNRRPPSSTDASFVTFSINPQVHVSDDRALFENASAQEIVVREAGRVSGGLPVVVGNIALIGRHGPYPDGPHRPDGLSANADPRLGEPLAAAWTVASIQAVADGGAVAASWFEVSGDRGLFGLSPRPPAPVLTAAAELAKSNRLVVASPSDVAALAFRSGGELEVLVANLTATARVALLSGLSGDSMSRSSPGASGGADVVPIRAGRATVILEAFEVLRLRAVARAGTPRGSAGHKRAAG